MDREAWKLVGMVFIVLIALLIVVVALRRRKTLPGETESPPIEQPEESPPQFPSVGTRPTESPMDSGGGGRPNTPR